MIKPFRFAVLLLPGACAFLSLTGVFAAEEKIQFPDISQHSMVKQHVGLTEIEVDYSRPNKNEREIFGGLVPYGKLWRTGANEPTKIKFSGPVHFGDKEIPAGEYALLTIPTAEEWTIILSKDAKLASAADYKEENDAARVMAKAAPLTGEVETFTIGFTEVKGAAATLYFDWDTTRAAVKITTDDTRKITQQLETAATHGTALDPQVAYQAASFYYENNLDMAQAAKWVDQAIAKNPKAWFMQFKKAQIQTRLGNKEEANAAAQKTIELLKASKTPDEAAIKSAQQIIDRAK
ncbi:MAG TPA: DUF2911 domain-containing protein [Chthoniobacterales bacterium]|nr:DUF2911 domain-containing protein [Chthoniobacterales bacterium]